MDRTTCAIYPVNNRLAARCRVSRAFRYRLYDLAAFKPGSRSARADVAQPAGLQPGCTDDFQGFAATAAASTSWPAPRARSAPGRQQLLGNGLRPWGPCEEEVRHGPL